MYVSLALAYNFLLLLFILFLCVCKNINKIKNIYIILYFYKKELYPAYSKKLSFN